MDSKLNTCTNSPDIFSAKQHLTANSGSQVNTVMPNYMHQFEFPMLPLCDLVNHPLNLVGLGGTRTHPLGFVILRVQVKEIVGYDEDVVFLVVLDESEFAQCIPIVVGTCTLGRIVNVIKESEMDRLSMPWVVARVSSLLSRRALWQKTWEWQEMAPQNMGPQHPSSQWVRT